jgi:site-specific DNA-methyltransferase (adenine-specific)
MDDLNHINESLRSLARPVEFFKLDPNNARLHSPANISTIAASLKRFGQQKPIVALEDGTVVAGNGTLTAAMHNLGWKHIAAVTFQDRAAAKQFALADNRSAELAIWNEAELAKQLIGFADAKIDMADIGFDTKSIAYLIRDKEHKSLLGVEQKQATVDIKKNENIAPGSFRVIHGDSADELRKIDHNSIDAIVCDPPYEIGFHGSKWDSSGIAFNVDMWKSALCALKPGGHVLAFGATKTYHRLATALEDAGFVIVDCIAWMYSSGMPHGKTISGGFGTQLKPCYEPCVVAIKPRDGTVESNMHEHGVGVFFVDRSRIQYSHDEAESVLNRVSKPSRPTIVKTSTGPANPPHQLGRWPGNVLLDEHAAMELAASTGEASSRFFFVSKPSQNEKDAGMPVGAENTHLTVKPVDLMRYLVRLVCPVGGTILDPFAGSGSTGCAAICEGMNFVGIELDQKHASIAEKRIEWWRNKALQQDE